MNVKLFRPARLMSFVLAATVAFGSTAMAADSVSLNEQNTTTSVVNEQDVPVVVSTLVTGTAVGIGTVEALGVNVRVNPTTDADIVTVLDQGKQVVVLSQDGDWYRVSCDGVNGFVKSDYVSVTNSGEASLGYGLVKCATANIRSSASTDSDSVATLSESDAVTITGITDGWYEVTANGVSGYVRSDLVDPTADIPAEKIYDYAVIECAAANLRSEPDSSSAKTDILYNGSLCTLIAQDGDWYEVQYGDATGYVLASLMSTTNNTGDGSTTVETYNTAAAREKAEADAAAAEEAAKQEAQKTETAQSSQTAPQAAPSSSSSSSTSSSSSDTSSSKPSTNSSSSSSSSSTPAVETEDTEETTSSSSSSGSSSIVSVAEQYLGVPYVWGGTSPSGFDCSGFVQYVFRQCGYSVSRTADNQYYDGTSVSYSNLQAGDLIFFCNTYATSGISHVGIYIGGGQFIHCANGGVKISSLSESYYSSRFYSACRIA